MKKTSRFNIKIPKWVERIVPSTNWQIRLASGLLPMLILLLPWALIRHYPFGDKTFMAIDFSPQYLGLYGFLKHTVLNWDWSGFFYSFSKSIGGAMIGIWGFNLISPFNIFYVLLPVSKFHWAVFLSIWLRYGAIGMAFSHLLIKRYQGLITKPWLVPLLSTAYALSGMLVAYQMNPIFYDGMIMLPLVITYLEEVLEGKNPLKYVLVLALSLFLHFYMGYMICLFVALYAIHYISPRLADFGSWKEHYKIKLKTFLIPLLKTLGWSILAAGLVAFLLLPIFYNLLLSKGALDSQLTFDWKLQLNPFNILAKLMVGGYDAKTGWGDYPNLPNIYIGALGLVGYLLYFSKAPVHRYRKITAGLISLIFLVSVSHEFTNKIWHMGQNPAGFFFRFSWIISFFMLLLAFQALKTGAKLSKTEGLIGIWLAVTSSLYVFSIADQYSFISLTQLGKFTRITERYPFAVFLIGLSTCFALLWLLQKLLLEKTYQGWKLLLMSFSISLPAFLLLQKGYLLTQIHITLFSWLAVLLFLYLQPKKKIAWVLLLLLTSLEMSYNTFLSQRGFGYQQVSHMTRALTSMNKVKEHITTDLAQESSPFYRVAAEGIFSYNDPFLFDFAGTTTFTSNLEVSMVNLFNAFGLSAGNAGTTYGGGTPLTDALFGIHYYLAMPPYPQNEKGEPIPYIYYPGFKRLDVPHYYDLLLEDNYLQMYKNPLPLSIAFAVDKQILELAQRTNQPITMQNEVLNAFSGQKADYIEEITSYELTLENFDEHQSEDSRILKRQDSTKPAKMILSFIPDTDDTYYLQTSNDFRYKGGELKITLNDNQLYHTTHEQIQLLSLASQAKGQTITLEISTESIDELNITTLAIARSKRDLILPVLEQVAKQNLMVTKWENNLVEGHIDVNEHNTVMLTSIPYNKGWAVRIDGQVVKTQKALEGLLAFPISSGHHDIQMIFTPPGWHLGLVISGIALILLLGLCWSRKGKNITSQRGKETLHG